jgi:prepilin-type N-terminal cleavage/methylation domain-containing protein
MDRILNFQFSKKAYFVSKGFSLVELLIVITIIGLLSTIVLNSLSTSREKAYDSKIKQQLNSFRTAAEIYYNNQEPTSYGTAAGCNSGVFNDVNAENGTPAIYLSTLPAQVQVTCQSSGPAYAVKALLYSGENHWCVDSRGSSRMIEGTITGPSTFCP